MSPSSQKLTPWQQACRLTGNNPDAKISMQERADIIYRASCKMLGQDPLWIPDCSAIEPEFRPGVIAHYMLQVIVKALNGPWKQDWNSWTQKKWCCWFALDKPGFRFRVAGYDFVGTSVTGGPRLCLKSKERAEFLGTHCITLFRDLLGAGELAPQAFITA
jgi:hypothetical protein